MEREKLLEWLDSQNMIIGNDPDDSSKQFVIVQSWDTVNHPNFKHFKLLLAELEIEEYNFGFADEYTTCSECGSIIRTSPDSYDWSPDYWLNCEDGEIICRECLTTCEDDYIEWLVRREKPSGSILDVDKLIEHGFTVILEGLKNGFHPGDTDSPSAILAYLKPCYNVVFLISNSQFTTGFDVLIRNPYDYFDSEDTIEISRVSEDTIKEIRSKMVKDTFPSKYGNSDTLFTEFANLYTAENMKSGLKAIASLPTQENGTTRLVKVKQDGIECLDVTASEFIAGDKAREFLK